MFILNFLGALVIPRKMVRFANMPVIISVAIFLLGSYVLALPHMNYVSKHRYEIVQEQNSYDLMMFSKLSEDDLSTLRGTKAKVENGTIKRTDTLVEAEPYIFDVEYNGVMNHIYLVFDLYDVLDPNQDPKYDIVERFGTINKVEGENYYLIVFYQDSILYKMPKNIKEIPYSKNDFLDFGALENGIEITNFFIDLYMPSIKYEATFASFISTVVYTFIIILIVWLFFKLSGSIITLKEFYNMGALCSIIPLALIFIFSWIFPTWNLMFYYSTLFGIYFLVIMFYINSKGKVE